MQQHGMLSISFSLKNPEPNVRLTGGRIVDEGDQIMPGFSGRFHVVRARDGHEEARS